MYGEDNQKIRGEAIYTQSSSDQNFRYHPHQRPVMPKALDNPFWDAQGEEEEGTTKQNAFSEFDQPFSQTNQDILEEVDIRVQRKKPNSYRYKHKWRQRLCSILFTMCLVVISIWCGIQALSFISTLSNIALQVVYKSTFKYNTADTSQNVLEIPLELGPPIIKEMETMKPIDSPPIEITTIPIKRTTGEQTFTHHPIQKEVYEREQNLHHIRASYLTEMINLLSIFFGKPMGSFRQIVIPILDDQSAIQKLLQHEQEGARYYIFSLKAITLYDSRRNVKNFKKESITTGLSVEWNYLELVENFVSSNFKKNFDQFVQETTNTKELHLPSTLEYSTSHSSGSLPELIKSVSHLAKQSLRELPYVADLTFKCCCFNDKKKRECKPVKPWSQFTTFFKDHQKQQSGLLENDILDHFNHVKTYHPTLHQKNFNENHNKPHEFNLSFELLACWLDIETNVLKMHWDVDSNLIKNLNGDAIIDGGTFSGWCNCSLIILTEN